MRSLRPLAIASRSALPPIHNACRYTSPLRLLNRNPLQLVRLPARRWQSTGNFQTPQVIHVRRPTFTRQRLLVWVAYSFIIYKGLQLIFAKLGDLLGIHIEEEAEDDAKAGELPQREVDADGNMFVGEDEEFFFIPLQMPQQLPRQSYKGSDPEWMEFVKLTRDQQRLHEIMLELATIVTKDIARLPLAKIRLGPNIAMGRYWLDYIIPDVKPPVYSRHGLAFITEGIALTDQIIPHTEYESTNRIIYPSALLSGIAKSFELYYLLKRLRLKSHLGWKLNRNDQILADNIARMNRFKASTRDAQLGSDPSKSSGVPEGLRKDTGNEAGTNASRLSNNGSQNPQGTLLSALPTLPRVALGKDLDLALTGGKIKYRQQYLRSVRSRVAPEGACLMFGSVEVIGGKGRLKLYVEAAYEPKDRKWSWVNIDVIHFWPALQKPRGGP